jgi:hypothetical protein
MSVKKQRFRYVLRPINVIVEYPDNSIRTYLTGWKSNMRDQVKLKKYNLTIARLLEVILSMSEEQQKTMLQQADDLVSGDRRGFLRKSCSLQVDFATTDRTHKGFIKNISRKGVFIEAKAPIMIGEEVLMVFKVNGNSADVKLRGEIAHATRWGIGIEFIPNGPDFDEMIGALIQSIR